jgi:hypothetical protein
MSLTALFLSLCLYTPLPCDKVEVSYANLGTNVLGRATKMSTGRLIIQLDNSLKTSPDWLQRNVMLHEVSHLVVWHENPNRLLQHHGPTFRSACLHLAASYGAGKAGCIKGIS